MAVHMGPQTPLIMAEHLTKTFPLPEGKGTFTVRKDVSVTIHAGEVVALLGRSGSGKSTLLRILAGLIQQHLENLKRKGVFPSHRNDPSTCLLGLLFCLVFRGICYSTKGAAGHTRRPSMCRDGYSAR